MPRPYGNSNTSQRPRYEIADILRRYLPQYLKSHRISAWQHKILYDLQACRTAALGGHIAKCDRCAYQEPAFNSCHNRHCPKCLGMARSRWVKARLQELLPVPYYHLVFTLPHRLNTLAQYNKKLLYDMFYAAVAYTLLRFGRDPKHLGAEMGFIAVLHTWGKGLCTHIHWHVILVGGGLSDDGKWQPLPDHDKFAFPVFALSKVVRGRFLKLLRLAYERGKLVVPAAEAELASGQMFEYFLDDLAHDRWLTYVKRPFGGPEQMVKYVGRYTHRVALTNNRLLSIANGQIQLRGKDYRNNGRPEVITLSAEEFIRRFLNHTLPKRFRKIRYGGFLAANVREKKLEMARRALGIASSDEGMTSGVTTAAEQDADDSEHRCPQCRIGTLRPVAIPLPSLAVRAMTGQPDTS